MDKLSKAISALENAESDIADALRCLEGVDEIEGHHAALDAINQIRRGDYGEAITTLEREFLPKFARSTDAELAYRRAML